MNQEEIRERVQELAPWFHHFELAGVPTAPDHFLGNYPADHWRTFQEVVPDDLEGRSVLDVGCNAGYFSLRMKERGAGRVLGIDSDPRYLAQARLAADVSGADIEFRQMSVYDVPRLRERFDLVLFLGVLYHLRHPLLALDLLYEHVVDDLMVFQTMIRGSLDVEAAAPDHPFSERDIFDRSSYPKLHFVEHKYAADPTNWWIPNRACAEAMLRSAGFTIVSRPVPEVFLCRHGAAAPRDHLQHSGSSL